MKNEIPKKGLFMMTFLTALLIALLTVTLVSCGNKVEPVKDTEVIADENNVAKYSESKEPDAEFVVNATIINLKEIKLGQLAQSNYALIDVSNLGKMMEKEHSETLNEIEILASKKQITIPKSLTGNNLADYEKLKNMVGAKFDKAYCNMMVKGHQDAIEIFTDASINSTDNDIKAWANSKLPALKNHLEHSLACQAKVGAVNDTQSKATSTLSK